MKLGLEAGEPTTVLCRYVASQLFTFLWIHSSVIIDLIRSAEVAKQILTFKRKKSFGAASTGSVAYFCSFQVSSKELQQVGKIFERPQG